MIGFNIPGLNILKGLILNGSGCSMPAMKEKSPPIPRTSHPLLNDVVINKILYNLDVPDIKNLSEVSFTCEKASNDKNLWSQVCQAFNVFQTPNNLCNLDINNTPLAEIKKSTQMMLFKSRAIARNCLSEILNNLAHPLNGEIIRLVQSESIADMNRLKDICQARDTLVVWDKLAQQIPNQVAPQLQDMNTVEELISSAAEFQKCQTYQNNLVQITDLILSGCSLTSLPAEIGNLINLTHLNVGHNQLTSLPAEIGNLINLQSLDANNNQMTSLPNEIGNLINLQSLDARNNQMTSLPNEIGNLINLQSLDASNNQLTSLPPEIGNLINLQSLDPSNNQMTSLPNEIGNLINLQSLDPSNNQMTSLPNEIGNLINLQSLGAYNNQLTSLPTEIGNLINLQSLDVGQNQLTSLPDTIKTRTFLRVTDINFNNNLLSLRERVTVWSLLCLYDET